MTWPASIASQSASASGAPGLVGRPHDVLNPEHGQEIGLRPRRKVHAAPFELGEEERPVHKPRGERRRHRHRHQHGDPRLPVARQFEHDHRGRDRRAEHRRRHRPDPCERVERGRARDVRQDRRRDQPEGQPRQRADHQRGREDAAPHPPRHGDRHRHDLHDAEDHRLGEEAGRPRRRGRRLVADADDVRERDRDGAQQRPRSHRPQVAGDAGRA